MHFMTAAVIAEVREMSVCVQPTSEKNTFPGNTDSLENPLFGRLADVPLGTL